MREEPDQVRAVAAQHVAYWRGLDARGYIGEIFADRSGGLITLEVDSNEEAERLIAADPFVSTGLAGSLVDEGRIHRPTDRQSVVAGTRECRFVNRTAQSANC
jgi:uncharacterized protein YciI